MWAAIFNKNTASFSICKLSKLSAPEPTLVPGTSSPEGQLDSDYREESVKSGGVQRFLLGLSRSEDQGEGAPSQKNNTYSGG
jgi:hypothetical protein